MNTALCWLGFTVIATSLMWIPYILNSFVVRGIWPTLGYSEDLPPLSDWAVRAKKAHYNAVENLILFAPLVFAHLALGDAAVPAEVLGTVAMIYFLARVAHFVVFVAKIPVLRTLAFLSGWGVTVYLAAMLVLHHSS